MGSGAGEYGAAGLVDDAKYAVASDPDGLEIMESAGKVAGMPDACSFTPDTPVLLANGNTEPIKDVKVGDKVEATDPSKRRCSGERCRFRGMTYMLTQTMETSI